MVSSARNLQGNVVELSENFIVSEEWSLFLW